MPVPNRYFGVFQSGEIKVRGIEARRRDTPPFIAKMQMEMLEILARAPSADDLPEYIPLASALVEKKIKAFRESRIPLDDLLITQKLSRESENYRTPSPATRAALQLIHAGRHISAGQRVRFLFTRGKPGVLARDLGNPPKHEEISHLNYLNLLERAANTVLQPFGINQTNLKEWIIKGEKPIKQLSFCLIERTNQSRTIFSARFP